MPSNLPRSGKLWVIGARMNDLETRLGPGEIDKQDMHHELSDLLWKVIEGACSDEEWAAFCAGEPKLSKYVQTWRDYESTR
jgi:hypothetical protein